MTSKSPSASGANPEAGHHDHAGPDAVEELLREVAPQVLGVLARRFGEFDAAEDAVQEALLAAAVHWPKDGVPDNPRGWLIQAGARQMIDRLRSERARQSRESTVALREPQPGAEVPGHDDTLLLLFMCCHPALTPASAIALTLRAVGGLTTAEIANAFVVPESTMAQRISRAKQRIRNESMRLPTGHDEWAPRLRSVLRVLYLIFNEGYASSVGSDLNRRELSGEAIRLARLTYRLLPDDGEVAGLLALMLLTDARRPARTGPRGELIPLDEQDRARWDRELIAEGIALTLGSIAKGAVGEYQLQAAIAAVHDQATRAEDTDWNQILGLYGLLEQMTGNPMVTLNRAVATAMVHGPAAGLAVLDQLDDRLAGHYRLDAVRGHLLERAGDLDAAITCYRSAAARTTSLPERNYLTFQAARLNANV